MLRLTRITLGLAVMLVQVTATSVVAAAEPQNDICLSPSGNVRFVRRGTACRTSERLVTWNTQSLPGPTGPAGPVGPVGPVGPQGAVGPQGPVGPIGPVGPVGPQGPQGANGADGATGSQGPVGPQGTVGAAGADGANGAVGPQGAPGADGANGAVGPQGPQGPAAEAGPGPALVLDRNNAIVGHYINRTGDVLVNVDGDRFVVAATRRGFVSGGQFVHRADGCTDAPSIAASANGFALGQVALVRQGEAWLPDFAAATIDLPEGATVFLQSVFMDGSFSQCLEVQVTSAGALRPLRSVSLSRFATPFHLQ